VSLMNDDNFRHDCARYTEHISEGRHDPEWLVEAWAAHERRRVGDFDDYLAQKFEEDWDVKLPEHLNPKRGSAENTASPGEAKSAKDEEGMVGTAAAVPTPGSGAKDSDSPDKQHGGPNEIVVLSSLPPGELQHQPQTTPIAKESSEAKMDIDG
jgi:hypothetical protein